jgi:anthranilate phosphoribosyltransferase
MDLAEESIDTGKAFDALNELIELSQELSKT